DRQRRVPTQPRGPLPLSRCLKSRPPSVCSTQGRKRQILGVSQQRLLEFDWRGEMQRGLLPITHRLAVAAFNAGLEGLVVASAADPSGQNLIAFIDRLRAVSRLSVIRGDRL